MNTKKFQINNLKKVFIIAEIGVNHEGNFSKCKKLIELAARSGANAVKLQTVEVEDSYDKKTSSFKVFKKKNFTDKQLKKLKRISNKKGVLFFSTPGDIKSLERLVKLGVPAVKISSGLMNHYPLLKKVIKSNIPLIISTGMANKNDLLELKKFLKKYNYKKLAVLKCTSEYPAKEKNVNLNSLQYLKKLFNCTVGYSDHTTGLTAPVVAVSLGAKIIEKHITLNRKQKDSDHKISLEFKEFSKMVNNIREAEKILGSKNFSLPNSLKNTRKLFRRYLFTKKKIKKGEKFNFKNIIFKRSRTKTSGLDPKYYFYIANKKSRFDLNQNVFLKKNHIFKN